MDVSGIGRDMQQNALDALQRAADAAETRPGVPLGAPAVNDVERFEAALAATSGNEMRMEMNGGPAPIAEPITGSIAAPITAQTVGDRILGGISSISETVQAGRAEVVQALDKKELSQVDLLKAQFAMMESSNLVSAVSKTAEKLTSAVKTLQQG